MEGFDKKKQLLRSENWGVGVSTTRQAERVEVGLQLKRQAGCGDITDAHTGAKTMDPRTQYQIDFSLVNRMANIIHCLQGI